MNANRIALALAACEGLTDLELSQRGAGAFLKMIERKRAYAKTARYYGAALEKVVPIAEANAKELTAMKAAVDQLEQLDKPVDNVSEAASLLAGIANAGGNQSKKKG